jgi:hypothetical protein
METFAGFAEQTDYEVGRLVAQLEKIGAMENTLFSTSSATTARARRADPRAPTTR